MALPGMIQWSTFLRYRKISVQGTMACVSDPDGKVTWKAGPGIPVERDLQVYGLIG